MSESFVFEFDHTEAFTEVDKIIIEARERIGLARKIPPVASMEKSYLAEAALSLECSLGRLSLLDRQVEVRASEGYSPTFSAPSSSDNAMHPYELKVYPFSDAFPGVVHEREFRGTLGGFVTHPYKKKETSSLVRDSLFAYIDMGTELKKTLGGVVSLMMTIPLESEDTMILSIAEYRRQNREVLVSDIYNRVDAGLMRDRLLAIVARIDEAMLRVE